MRNLIFLSLIALFASFHSLTANAYVIHNNTGNKAYFRGEDCFPCFKGEIENKSTAACPGNERGCRNTTTVRLETSSDNRSYFDGACSLTAPTQVTAHGDVYAYKDHVVVKNDQGIEIYNGPWKKGDNCIDFIPLS